MPVTTRWRGDAKKVAQVDKITPANVEIGDIFTATINGKTVSFTATAATVGNVTAGFVTAWNASTIQEFAEITASDSTTFVTLTADTAGKPFTVTSSATDGGAANTQTFVRAAVTTNSGPNDVSVGANWDQVVIPAAGDTVIIDQGSSSLLYGLDQSAVALAAIHVLPGFAGTIGLPSVNIDNNSATYFEYRPTYLQYGATLVNIRGGGGRIKLDNGSVACTWNVDDKAQRVDDKIPQVLLKGTNAANILNISKGDVAVGWFAEASTLVTVTVGFQKNKESDSYLWTGLNVTLTSVAFTQTGGLVFTNSALATAPVVVVSGGVLTHDGTGGIAASLKVNGGTVVYNSTGTLGGAPVVSGTGHLDFSQNLRAKTVTNAIDVYGKDAKISDPNKSVTTLVIDLDETANSANMNIGTNLRITRGAVA